jgi:hypothetical protein
MGANQSRSVRPSLGPGHQDYEAARIYRLDMPVTLPNEVAFSLAWTDWPHNLIILPAQPRADGERKQRQLQSRRWREEAASAPKS